MAKQNVCGRYKNVLLLFTPVTIPVDGPIIMASPFEVRFNQVQKLGVRWEIHCKINNGFYEYLVLPELFIHQTILMAFKAYIVTNDEFNKNNVY